MLLAKQHISFLSDRLGETNERVKAKISMKKDDEKRQWRKTGQEDDGKRKKIKPRRRWEKYVIQIKDNET